jgi:hypothetical protein
VARNEDPLGDRIREWVAERVSPRGPLEQKDLAELSGQKLVRVHRYVTGQLRLVPLAFLDAILRVLGTTLVDAIQALPKTTTPPGTVLTKHQRAVVRAMSQLAESEQVLVVQMARGLQGRVRRRVQ